MAFSLYMIASAIVVLGLVLQKIANHFRVLRFKKQHGCQPETKYPQSERFVGYDFYKVQAKASKEKNIVKVSQKRYQECGNTWSVSMMGQVSFHRKSPAWGSKQS